MGYFNYFIKQLIRIFTRKFFWIILFFIFLTMFLVYVDNGVFANSPYSFDDSYFSQSDIDAAKSYIGSTIWDNTDNDIYLYYAPGWVYNNNFNYGKAIAWFNTNNLSSDTKYIMHNQNEVYTNSFGTYNLFYPTAVGSSSNSIDFHCTGIYQHTFYTNETRSGSNIFLHQASMSSLSSNPNSIFIKPIRTHFDFVDENDNVIFNATNPLFINPYIVNSNEVSNWSFDNLIISPGSLSYDFSNYYGLVINNGYDNVINLDPYYNSNDNTFVIPKNQLSNYINIRDGNIIDFEFSYRSMISVNLFDLGNYNISLTTEEQNNINEDSEKYVQGQILEEQQKTTQAVENVDNSIKNLDNTITDTNVDDITDNDLPSDNTEDITADGVNGIFTSIYNAFCTGNAQDIVFPIPFTAKNITLSPNYVNDMLTNSGASWVITIIQAFWWYLISRFIIKDVMNKINKIKSGNIEDIETTNIRGDML